MSADAIMELGIFNLSADKTKKAPPSAPTATPRRMELEEEEELEDLSSLFWQPGKWGYYSPRPGKGTAERLSAFRNVGR
jgi:E3 ubiquitin-protein ligase EDD1